VSGAKNPKHGEEHLPGRWDAIPPPFGRVYPGNPVRVQLDVPFPADDSAHWGTYTIDPAVRTNAYLESDGSQDAYIKRKVSLGPGGAVWAAIIGYAGAPDAGILSFAIASIPSPNPIRARVSDIGTLQPDGSGGADPLTFVDVGTHDSYAASLTDDAVTMTSFRLMGSDGATLTTLSDTDSFIPCASGDGGAGEYAVRVTVDGKNDSSSGYVLRLTEITFVRLDDSGFA
jgi:hypothetical protein